MQAQSENAIDLAVPFATTGPNSLRLTGGFSNEAGSFLKLTDSIENLFGQGETSHASAEIGFRLRRAELGVRRQLSTSSRVEVGIDVYGESFRYNQFLESSVLSFNRDIEALSNLNAFPDDLINYVRSGYGAKIFAEIPSASKKSRLSFTYDYDISAYRPVNDDTAQWFSLLNFRGPNVPGSLTGIQTGKLTASYLYNTVDNPLQPTHGAMLRVSGDLAGIGGNVNFFEPDIEAKYFHRGFRRRDVIALHVRGRMIMGYDGKAVPPVDRYYMGGEDELRGFDSWSVGPIGIIPSGPSIGVLNPDGTQRTALEVINNTLVSVDVVQLIPVYRFVSLGGDTKIVANAEYRIRLFGPFTLALFDDVGINRTTFVHQLRLYDAQVNALNTEFPQAQFTDRTIIVPGMQDPRMSMGVELQTFVPKVNIPVRFYAAWNPLALEGYLRPPVVLDPSTFPNAATLSNALAEYGSPVLYREPGRRFQFSIGRTF